MNQRGAEPVQAVSSRSLPFYREIAATLRNEILQAKLRPGQQLPTRVELQKRFRTTNVTLQNALDVLAEEGFVRAKGRLGTFVAEKLPNHHHYALVFPPGHERSQFAHVLRQEAVRFQQEGRRITVFENISEHTDTEDFQRLMGFVRAHRFSGVIFTHTEGIGYGSPLWEEMDLPRVQIMAPPYVMPDIPVVYPDRDAFIFKALDTLVARGRKRIALLMMGKHSAAVPERVEIFFQAAQERGLTCHPHWVQAVPPLAMHWAKNLMQLLFHRGQTDRPDGLVIVDDNLVEHATGGLVTAGVRVPDELEVVAHTNFPWPTPSAVPACRLGHDIRALLAISVDLIDRQQRGETVPDRTLLPAVFERELAPAGVVGAAR